jgi:putative ABC transport system permease protein
MLFFNHVSNAMDSFRSNRSRSILTALGIAIGMGCIVLILSMSGGLKKLIESQVTGADGNIIVVRPESNRGANDKNFLSVINTSQTYARSSLTIDDLKTISKIKNISAAAPLAVSENDLKGDHDLTAGKVVATNEHLPNTARLTLANGQFLGENLSRNSIVLGYTLAQRLFDSSEVVGETVKIKGVSFLVVGVLQELDNPINYNDIDFDEVAFINYEKAADLNSGLQVQQINVKLANQSAIPAASSAIEKNLLKSHKGEQDFVVLSGKNISSSTSRLFDAIASILSLVAGVSLIVGGIGVMNIMLVSVSERTREIGIEKAVGANNGNIMVQFLFESLLLSLVGGVLGLLFGYAFAFGAGSMMPFNPEFSWEVVGITLVVSVAIGCIFGLLPAARAARKDPIDSLRFYR